jgi:methylated-DNA-[protein]-cysteine S-methyltransferase
LIRKENSKILFWDQITSPIGDVFFVWGEEGVLILSFIEKNYSEKLSNFIKHNFRIIRSTSKLETQLKEYFEGVRKEFNIKLLASGTPYQKRVWRELLKVPYGETVSYGELAKRIGNPKGARSIGMAVHLNPIGIIIPCHRVIMSNGEIGGFAGPVFRKKWLLEHERSFRS